MPQVYLFPVSQFFDNSGNPISGGKLNWYAAGTTTPQNTYTDSTGNTAASNPVVCDSAGRAQVWLTNASYKLVIQTSAGVTLQTIDGINISIPPVSMAGVNSTDDVNIQQPTPATSGANQSSKNLNIQGSFWNGSAAATDQWQVNETLGTGTNPTSTLNVTHSGSTGNTSISLPAATPIVVGGDTGISRTAPAAFAFGNGTQGDTSASISAATLGVGTGGTVQFGVLNGASITRAGSALLQIGDGNANAAGSLNLTNLTASGTVNKVNITAPSSSSTLTIANGKTLTANNTLTLAGTDSTTMTFPTTSGNVLTDTSTNTAQNKNLITAAAGNVVTLVDTQDAVGAVTGNGTDQTIFTKTITANTIGSAKGFRLSVSGQSAGGNATMKIILGTTTLVSTTSTAGNNYYATIEVMNKSGVQNAQTVRVFVTDGATITAATGTTSAENLANAATIKLTANQTNPNTFTGKSWLVEIIQ